jgi:hypothetical protein
VLYKELLKAYFWSRVQKQDTHNPNVSVHNLFKIKIGRCRICM